MDKIRDVTTLNRLPDYVLLEGDRMIIATWLAQNSSATQRMYRHVLREFFKIYPRICLAEISAVKLTIFLRMHSKLKATSRILMKNTMSSLLTYATKVGHIDRNPALALDPITAPDRIFSKVLEEEQVTAMINATHHPRNRLAISLLYYTGMRVAELSHLRLDSFRAKKEGAVLNIIGKGNRERTVTVPEHLWQELKSYWAENNYRGVDPALKSSHDPYPGLSTAQIWRIIKKAAVEAGLDVKPSPHWMRHSSATHALENGAPLHVVRTSLGHRNISTTDRYLEIRPKASIGEFLKKGK